MRLYLIALCCLCTNTTHGSLLVGNYLHGRISRFDDNTGASQGVFAGTGEGVTIPEGMTLGPDGSIFVVMDDFSSAPETVTRFTQTGQPLGVFSTLGNGTHANDLTFGPDGNLYVSFATAGFVRRYSGINGAFIDNFTVGGGLSTGAGLTFGPDGNLYVSSYETGSVKRYDGLTGQYIGDFASGGGLSGPTGLEFGPDGSLFVSSRDTDEVKRYDAITGAFLENFAQGNGLDSPEHLAFGPDGNLYVASFNTNQVKRFDGTTGAFIDDFVPAAGPAYPVGLLFIPSNVPEPSTATLVAFCVAALLPRLVLHPPASRKMRWRRP